MTQGATSRLNKQKGGTQYIRGGSASERSSTKDHGMLREGAVQGLVKASRHV